MRLLVLGLFTLVFTAGCTNAPEMQAFNAAANQHIRAVAIANPPSVDKVNVAIINHPGSSFGLIGGLVAAADMSGKSSRYNEAAGQFDWDDYATRNIAQALQQSGYQVSTVTLRPEEDKKFAYLKQYPDVSSDAILDYYLTVGQVASGATTNYVPTVRLRARLMDAKAKTVLYEQNFTAGLPLDQEEVNLPATREYPNIKALVANSGESVEALKQGIRTIALRLASDLQKQ